MTATPRRMPLDPEEPPPEANRPAELPHLPPPNDARMLAPEPLLARARLERTRFGRTDYDERYEWEIFRRAVLLRGEHRWLSDQAWAALHELYGRMVRSWICGYSFKGQSIDRADEEADALVNATWARFFTFYTPEKLRPDLASILTFLRLCAVAVVRDELKYRGRMASLPDDELGAFQAPDDFWDVEAADNPLIAAIRACILDEDERLVASLSWIDGEPPRVIAAELPDRFPNAEAVSTIKERMLRRIKRDPVILALLNLLDAGSI